MANKKKEITKSERKTIKKYNRNKIKYICHGCQMKVWGKSGLSIHCNDCDEDLEEEAE